MRNFKSLFVEIEKVSSYFEEIGNDIIIFKGIKRDNIDWDLSKEELVRIVWDRNVEFYNIILVRSKKLYGNNNMDKLFKEEIDLYMKKNNSNKILFSEFMNNFNNNSLFSLLYNFRSSWRVNSYNDRFENWCRRSKLLKKEKINVYNRLWLVK